MISLFLNRKIKNFTAANNPMQINWVVCRARYYWNTHVTHRKRLFLGAFAARVVHLYGRTWTDPQTNPLLFCVPDIKWIQNYTTSLCPDLCQWPIDLAKTSLKSAFQSMLFEASSSTFEQRKRKIRITDTSIVIIKATFQQHALELKTPKFQKSKVRLV
jgi:hypothetical protein